MNYKKIYLIAHPRPKLLTIIETYCQQGIFAIQYQDKKSSDSNYIKIANQISLICQKYQVKFFINERVHLLEKIKCKGINLSQKRTNIKKLQKQYPDLEIQVLIQTINQAKRALKKGIKLLSVGPIFPSKTKKNNLHVSMKELEKIAALGGKIIIFGNINCQTIQQVNPSKYDLMASSSYLLNSQKPIEALQKLLAGAMTYAQKFLATKIKSKITSIQLLTGGQSANTNFLATTKNQQKYHLRFCRKTLDRNNERLIAKIFPNTKYFYLADNGNLIRN